MTTQRGFRATRCCAIIFDNLKSAVVNGSGRNADMHREFMALCGHFCLEPIACARRDPESKGIVEGSVRYVKHNALAGRADQLSSSKAAELHGSNSSKCHAGSGHCWGPNGRGPQSMFRPTLRNLIPRFMTVLPKTKRNLKMSDRHDRSIDAPRRCHRHSGRQLPHQEYRGRNLAATSAGIKLNEP